jgi:peptidoglycan hydrolase-like protein with peptidoglycan-binding domain
VTRKGYDATTWENIPGDAQFVFLYNDGDYAAPEEAYQHFQSLGVPVATIAVEPTTIANVLDYEVDNPTYQNPGLVNEWLTRNPNGAIYANLDDQQWLIGQGVSPHYWSLAHWTDELPTSLPAGVLNIQWDDPGPYDNDLVADYWPGVDSAPVTPPPTGLPVYTGRTLQPETPDMEGTDVLALQKALNAHGASPVLAEDGDFGPVTEQAVIRFQTAYFVDGIAGPLVFNSLDLAYTETVEEGSVSVYVGNLQRALNSHGYGLTVDDDFGPLTKTAVEQWEESYFVDGKAGPETKTALGIPDD